MSRYFRRLCAAGLVVLLAFGPVSSDPSALAQLGPGGAKVTDAGGTVVLTVPLTQAVPWRVSATQTPPQILVEFGDVVWSAQPDVVSQSVAEARVSKERAGWSQLALLLREPLAVATAEMIAGEDGAAVLEVRMLPTTAEEFRKSAEPGEGPLADAAEIASGGRVTVALDPGHGGIDPGAMADGLVEADLILAMARRLKETLLRTGRFDVVLTREEDVFVPLETRLTRAREAGAAVFLSLHADALGDEDGAASGLTVYRLADDAGDAADGLLTERHAATDLLTGVDLTGAGDDVALALMDIARRDTGPRTRALQRKLIEAFRSSGLHVNSRPARTGSYSVLKSAEIPSVLIELGFLSSEEDRERLVSEEWQEDAAQALAEALMLWQDEDRLRPGSSDR